MGGPARPRLTGFPRAALVGGVVPAARSLLGAHLVSGEVVVRVTEVEAYAGVDDPASHAWRGLTPRTEIMASRAGLAYVYFSYGMHWCLNVVAGPEGVASAVLIRAGTVVAGHDTVAARRAGIAERDWARGPARLTKALGVDAARLGVDLCADTSPLRLVAGTPPAASLIQAGPRVGVSRAADVPWRFWIAGEQTVSPYKRSSRLQGAKRVGRAE